MYNIMSCSGWEENSFLGPCSLSWLIAVLLFFIVVFSKRWIGEEAGWNFNTTGAFIGAYLPWFLVITFFGSYKFGLLAGILGVLVGGLLIGQFFGGSDGY